MKIEPFEIGSYYHVFNRGNNKDQLFIEEENYQYFLMLMKKYLIPIADIYSYCLLPNHFHFIIKIKEFELLPIAIQNKKTTIFQPFSNLFNAYTKAINKRYNRRGSLFQDRVKRKKIETDEYLKHLIIYVNTNTSHHNITNYKTYKYSSYKALTSNKSTLLKRDDVMKLFEDEENLKYNLEAKRLNLETIRDLLLE